MAVYLSFHYDRDHFRVQQIRNMGIIEGQPLLSSQDWEAVKRRGEAAITAWIDKEMQYKRAVVVLVGAQTATRKWVLYEIRKAWDDHFPLVGVRIHGLRDSSGSTDQRGSNPFEQVTLKGGGALDRFVTLHDPVGTTSKDVYKSIADNLPTWIGGAKKRG